MYTDVYHAYAIEYADEEGRLRTDVDDVARIVDENVAVVAIFDLRRNHSTHTHTHTHKQIFQKKKNREKKIKRDT
jgi:hypothetical protein